MIVKVGGTGKRAYRITHSHPWCLQDFQLRTSRLLSHLSGLVIFIRTLDRFFLIVRFVCERFVCERSFQLWCGPNKQTLVPLKTGIRYTSKKSTVQLQEGNQKKSALSMCVEFVCVCTAKQVVFIEDIGFYFFSRGRFPANMQVVSVSSLVACCNIV